MPIQTDGAAPYAPASAVIDVIRRYRDRGLQTPFTLDVLLRAGVAESLAPRTLQALKLLELVNDGGEPTEALVALGKAPTDEEYRERFAGLIHGVYAEVFSYVDPAEEGASGRIRGAFRSYTPRGQQERIVRLFLGLCAHAGIIPESAARVTAAANGGSTPRRERQAAPGRTPRRAATSARIGIAHDGLPPALAGLINELIAVGPSWNAEQRDRFLAAFRSMVDYSYPVRTSVPDSSDDEEESDDED